MNEIVTFFEKLSDKLSEATEWNITKMVDYKEVIDGDMVYAEIRGNYVFAKEDDWYISQEQHGEDSYSGIIIYPITDTKALFINYFC